MAWPPSMVVPSLQLLMLTSSTGKPSDAMTTWPGRVDGGAFAPVVDAHLAQLDLVAAHDEFQRGISAL